MPAGKAAYRAGARVMHEELGEGTVKRLRRDGRALMVSFDSHPSLLLEVKLREVVPAPDPAAPEAAPAAPPPPAAAVPDSVAPDPAAAPARPFWRPAAVDLEASEEAARSVEALRLGVVPRADLRPSSTGRDRELTLARQDLAATAEGGAARVFLGDYGAGKTHLLELLEHEALGAGFVVGRATLDARYAQPNQPMRIYRQLVSTLRYPGRVDVAGPEPAPPAPAGAPPVVDGRFSSGGGLEPLLRASVQEATETPALEILPGHLYLGPALHYYRQLMEHQDRVPTDLLLDWISGQRPEGNKDLDTLLRHLGDGPRGGRPTIYALKDFQPWAHVYANLLGGISTLARRQGYRGLVLLVDEAENYDLLGTQARVFADSLFRCLVLAALGDGAPFGEEAIQKGGFAPQKRQPIVYGWPQHIYLVAAMTPNTAGEQLLSALVGQDRLWELSQLSPRDYSDLSGRLCRLYCTAYPQVRLPGRLDQPLAEVLWSLLQREHISTPREATKLAVELLDLMRLRPGEIRDFLADVGRALC